MEFAERAKPAARSPQADAAVAFGRKTKARGLLSDGPALSRSRHIVTRIKSLRLKSKLNYFGGACVLLLSIPEATAHSFSIDSRSKVPPVRTIYARTRVTRTPGGLRTGPAALY